MNSLGFCIVWYFATQSWLLQHCCILFYCLYTEAPSDIIIFHQQLLHFGLRSTALSDLAWSARNVHHGWSQASFRMKFKDAPLKKNLEMMCSRWQHPVKKHICLLLLLHQFISSCLDKFFKVGRVLLQPGYHGVHNIEFAVKKQELETEEMNACKRTAWRSPSANGFHLLF